MTRSRHDSIQRAFHRAAKRYDAAAERAATSSEAESLRRAAADAHKAFLLYTRLLPEIRRLRGLADALLAEAARLPVEELRAAGLEYFAIACDSDDPARVLLCHDF